MATPDDAVNREAYSYLARELRDVGCEVTKKFPESDYSVSCMVLEHKPQTDLVTISVAIAQTSTGYIGHHWLIGISKRSELRSNLEGFIAEFDTSSLHPRD